MLFARRTSQESPAQPAPAAAQGNGAVPANARSVALPADAVSSRYTDLKVHLHRQLLELINLSMIEKMEPEEFRREVGEILRELLAKASSPITINEREKIVPDVLDEVLGLGPLEPLIKDPSVSDILVNTFSDVFVERAGQLEDTPVKFKDDRHLLRIIHKIVSGIGRRIDESQPTVDARLADGSRVNAVIPPVAVDGPLLSIRKFAKIPLDIAFLVEIGTITEEIAELLQAVVRCRLNVLISGGTGSGKTTMLNAMSRYIEDRERVVTIEDAAELQLQQRHVVRMETRPANIEGKGEITQRDLVKNSLRMRPDRIVVGEVRGGEAFDMLQAMNTGHEGSMTTIHANSCRDSLSRLEQMIGMAGLDLPARAMRAQIASALNVVIQLTRMSDGRRRLVSLHEVTGMEGDIITMHEIFKFRRLSTDAEGNISGEFQATGIRPVFVEQFESRGIELSSAIFAPFRPLE